LVVTALHFLIDIHNNRSILQYKSFEPNAKVDAKLFTLDRLTIPPGTSTMDHRRQGRR
jgi:hypothetical protein